MKILKNYIKNIIAKYYKYKINHRYDNVFKRDINKADDLIYNVYKEKNYFGDGKALSLEYADEYDLSLIVPVYNAEKYLRECLESLIKQNTNYKYEIICINDGSNDNSLNILNEYKDKITIYSQNNNGISYTRNKGISLAKGKYVGFIDNDDFVSDDYVDKLLSNAYKYDAGMVKCGHKEYVEGNNKIIDETESNFEVIKPIDERILKYDGYIWAGITKRELWNGFGSPVNYWYEDIITKLYLAKVSRCFVNLKEVMYFKRRHKNNASFILWNNSNTQCIDQYYLVKQILEIENSLGIKEDVVTYRCLFNELGPILYLRINGLSQDLKKAVFIKAAEYMNNRKEFYKDGFSYIEKNLYKSFINYDYKLWEYVAKYYIYAGDSIESIYTLN